MMIFEIEADDDVAIDIDYENDELFDSLELLLGNNANLELILPEVTF